MIIHIYIYIHVLILNFKCINVINEKHYNIKCLFQDLLFASSFFMAIYQKTKKKKQKKTKKNRKGWAELRYLFLFFVS